ncbi:MAG TPA: protein kinase [Thermoanaerobaculaceae bacterium]|nr:protein kinase [Thermoanaerobaculaceae bacterium]HRS15189.1 protein kinase [Thermoanaerobaculaceae bacterium]
MSPKRRADRLLRRAVERRWLEPSQLVALAGPAAPDEEGRDAQFEEWLERLLDAETPSPAEAETAVTLDPLPSGVMAVTSSSPPGPEELPLRGWDRYELVSLIGRGGMGRVFRARDPRLGRFVAIKLLRHDEPELAARFLREAQAQARVEHPAICRVYEVGEASGQPYIAMQLIDGASLRERAAELSLEQKLLVVREVALALHEAHRNGLVHRDVKPGNILLERGEEGEWRSYVVDFGLAREVEQPGTTLPGALMGTAAYMSPEQACGDLQALDRRTDVYSLGATLYELLSGVPPFTGRTDVEVLMKVVSEEPEPLRRRLPHLPRDVETIVQTCMAKEPSRRYPSARALADDLQRFLDGEPIAARPASVAYRLGRKIAKHRVVAGVVAAALVVAVAAAGVAARTAWVASRQERLAQELAGDVGYIEALLRHAHTSPPHDVRPERQQARQRLSHIEARLAAEGRVGRAPGNLALGRAWLALGEPEKARSRLQAAWDDGYRGPQVALALGQALGLLYQQAVERAERAEDPGQRERLRVEAAEKLGRPTLELLRAGEGSSAEASRLAEALIALYEERFDAALALARETVREYPWLYQAHKLEGDALIAQARRAAARGDYEAAGEAYAGAERALARAGEIGRSDAEILLADCQRLVEVAEVERRQGRSPAPALARAAHQGSLAALVNPDSAPALATLALAHAALADWQRDHGTDPQSSLAQAIALAEHALEVRPGDGPAAATLGWALTMLGDHEAKQGGDPRPVLDRAVASYQVALKALPTDAEISTNLGYAHDKRARWESSHGIDPRPSIAAAVAAYERAIAIDPAYANAHNTLGIAWWRQAEYERRAGLDPTASLARAEQSYRQAVALNINYAYAWANLGSTLRSQAVALAEAGLDPTARLEEARAAFRTASSINPDIFWAWSELAETELVAARWALARGGSPSPHLAAARPALERALALNPRSAESHHTSARLRLLEAEWIRREGGDPARAVAAGLREVAQALDINPRRPDTLAVRGALRLVRAGAGQADLAELRLAAADLNAALEANPLLQKDYGRYSEAAEQRLERGRLTAGGRRPEPGRGAPLRRQ